MNSKTGAEGDFEDENPSLSSSSIQLMEKEEERSFKEKFKPHRRYTVTELDTISEGDILEEVNSTLPHRVSSGANFSKIPDDRTSESISNSDRNENLEVSPPFEGKVPKSGPETPPPVLRKRIKDSEAMRESLEREFYELREFTNYELQVLKIEKGYDKLQQERDHLKEENEMLKTENDRLLLENKRLQLEIEDYIASDHNIAKNSKDGTLCNIEDKSGDFHAERDQVHEDVEQSKITTFDTDVGNLLDLSCATFETKVVDVDSAMNNELELCRQTIEQYKVELDSMKGTLERKHETISHLETNMANLKEILIQNNEGLHLCENSPKINFDVLGVSSDMFKDCVALVKCLFEVVCSSKQKVLEKDEETLRFQDEVLKSLHIAFGNNLITLHNNMKTFEESLLEKENKLLNKIEYANQQLLDCRKILENRNLLVDQLELELNSYKIQRVSHNVSSTQTDELQRRSQFTETSSYQEEKQTVEDFIPIGVQTVAEMVSREELDTLIVHNQKEIDNFKHIVDDQNRQLEILTEKISAMEEESVKQTSVGEANEDIQKDLPQNTCTVECVSQSVQTEGFKPFEGTFYEDESVLAYIQENVDQEFDQKSLITDLSDNSHCFSLNDKESSDSLLLEEYREKIKLLEKEISDYRQSSQIEEEHLKEIENRFKGQIELLASPRTPRPSPTPEPLSEAEILDNSDPGSKFSSEKADKSENFEFIDVPAPDVSMNYTFNYQLERSIFKNKLPADFTLSDSCDPLLASPVNKQPGLDTFEDEFSTPNTTLCIDPLDTSMNSATSGEPENSIILKDVLKYITINKIFDFKTILEKFKEVQNYFNSEKDHLYHNVLIIIQELSSKCEEHSVRKHDFHSLLGKSFSELNNLKTSISEIKSVVTNESMNDHLKCLNKIMIEKDVLEKNELVAVKNELTIFEENHNRTNSLLDRLYSLLKKSDKSNQIEHLNTEAKLNVLIEEFQNCALTKSQVGDQHMSFLDSVQKLCSENCELKNSISFMNTSLRGMQLPLKDIKNLKNSVHNDFIIYKKNIDESLNDIQNGVFEVLHNKEKYENRLIELEETIATLNCKNKKLLEDNELLKSQNVELNNFLIKYESLTACYEALKQELGDKEILIKDIRFYQDGLKNFLETLRTFAVLNDYLDKSESNDLIILKELERFVQDVNIAHGVMRAEIDNPLSEATFVESVNHLCRNNKHMSETISRTKLELNSVKQTKVELLNNARKLKELNNLVYFEMDLMKKKLLPEYELSMKEVGNLLKIFHNFSFDLDQLKNENDHLKTALSDYESLKLLKQNFQNLLTENGFLKEELSDLKSLNKELVNQSAKYEKLIVFYESLKKELQDNEIQVKNSGLLQEGLTNFIGTLKKFDVMTDYLKESKCSELDSLKDVERFIQDVNVARDIMRSENEHPETFMESVDRICRSNKQMSESISRTKTELNSLKQLKLELLNNAKELKELNKLISSEMVLLKKTLMPEYELSLKEVGNLSKGFFDFSNYLEELKTENETLKINLSDSQSLILLKENYEQLLFDHKLLESKFEDCEKSTEEHINLYDNLNMELDQFRSENIHLKNKMDELSAEISDSKILCETLKIKIRGLNDQNSSFDQYSNKIKECLINFINSIKYSGFETDSGLKYVEVILRTLIKNFGELIMVQNDFKPLEVSFQTNELNSLFNDAIQKLNSFLPTHKNNIDLDKSCQTSNEDFDKLKIQLDIYVDRIKSVLIALDHDVVNLTDINDSVWLFIDEKIAEFKNISKPIDNSGKCESVYGLEEKIRLLEKELMDIDSFKRQFAKEIHSLKPDLFVSDLMKLSLLELQSTMTTTIMEIENHVISDLRKDYETKLTVNSDKMHQLEEEDRKRALWISEIETENGRLYSGCKKYQEENDNLRVDLQIKTERITALENEVQEQKNKLSKLYSEELSAEKEETMKEFEIAYNEKTVAFERKMAEVITKLEEKSSRCHELELTVEDKVEKILSLEKNLNDLSAEKSNLEKDISTMRESLKSLSHDYDSCKKDMENALNSQIRELENMREEHQKLSSLLASNKESYSKQILELQAAVESKNMIIEKFNCLDKDAEYILKSGIKHSLENHISQVTNLNEKIENLSLQLNIKSNTFSNELANKTKIIEKMEKKVCLLNEEFKKENKMKASLKIELETVRNELFCVLNEKQILETQYDKDTKKLNSDLVFAQASSNDIAKEQLDLVKQSEYENISLKRQLEEVQHQLSILKEEKIVLSYSLEAEKKLKLSNEKQYEELQIQMKCLQSEKEALTEQYNESLKHEKEESLNLRKQLAQIENELLVLHKEKNDLKLSYENIAKIEKYLKNELQRVQSEYTRILLEKECLSEEYSTNLNTEKEVSRCLNSQVVELTQRVASLENELVRTTKSVEEEKQRIVNVHMDDSCPHIKLIQDCEKKLSDFDLKLQSEYTKFNLMKSNLEDDARCKGLLINELEAKLKNETLRCKEIEIHSSELNAQLVHSIDRLKKMEDKIKIQRDVFIKEKTHLELELAGKEKILEDFRYKIQNVKKMSEGLENDVNKFIKKASELSNKNLTDLNETLAVIQEQAEAVKQLKEQFDEEKEKATNLDEECEHLYTHIKYIESQLGQQFCNAEGAIEENKKLKEIIEDEKQKHSLLVLELEEARSAVATLQKQNEMLEAALNILKETEVKNYKINIENLLEDKKILHSKCEELQKKEIELQKNLRLAQKLENEKIVELSREVNLLRQDIVRKNTKIASLEIKLETDSLPFVHKAEMADEYRKKVVELTKELEKVKRGYAETYTCNVSPRANPHEARASSSVQSDQMATVTAMAEEIKQLKKSKTALKVLCQSRRTRIKELEGKLPMKEACEHAEH